MNRFIISILAVCSLLIGCNSEPKKSVTALKSETDSLAYVIGLSIADNLIAMDSTINIGVVCRAIADQASAKQKTIIPREEAKAYYLRYVTYVEPERKRGYEEQYLEDLAKNDRDYTRTESGLTYNIEVIGDENLIPRGSNDLISVCYTISRANGDELYSSYEKGDTTVMGLRDLPQGLEESVKMIGKGGKVKAWFPSKLAYGEEGDDELGISPFETLYYEVELVDVERNAAHRFRSHH